MDKNQNQEKSQEKAQEKVKKEELKTSSLDDLNNVFGL
jgi:hypothetical protein